MAEIEDKESEDLQRATTLRGFKKLKFKGAGKLKDMWLEKIQFILILQMVDPHLTMYLL